MKKKCIMFLLLSAFISICCGMYWYYCKVTEKVYIELEYLHYAENVNISFYGVEDYSEFTWWEHFEWFEHKTKEEEFDTYTIMLDTFNIELPGNIDWEEKNVVISFGRELKTLYYFPSWDQGERHIGRPVFMEEYKDNVAYLYLIDKTNMCNNQLVTDDMFTFNLHGEVPFTETESGWVW